MDAKEKLEALFAEVAQTHGLPLIDFDDEGRCAIAADGDYLFMQRTADSLRLTAPLGAYPPEAENAVYAALLKGNDFDGDALGAVLALNTETDEPVLLKELFIDCLDAGRLVNGIENFLSLARVWRERLAEFSANVPEEDEPEDDDGLDPSDFAIEAEEEGSSAGEEVVIFQ